MVCIVYRAVEHNVASFPLLYDSMDTLGILMGEQKSPKNSHLMIFMRALLTDGVRVCQVKAYHTELATTYFCMALIDIDDSETHWTSTLDIANEIHDPLMIFMIHLTRVVTHKGLDKCLGLDSISACLLF